MATDLEYALMAGGSYISTRNPSNRFPTPQGWTEAVETSINGVRVEFPIAVVRAEPGKSI
jgi:hypothetical protein